MGFEAATAMLTTWNGARRCRFWRDEQFICFYFLSWEEPPAPNKAERLFKPLTTSLESPSLIRTPDLLLFRCCLGENCASRLKPSRDVLAILGWSRDKG